MARLHHRPPRSHCHALCPCPAAPNPERTWPPWSPRRRHGPGFAAARRL